MLNEEPAVVQPRHCVEILERPSPDPEIKLGKGEGLWPEADPGATGLARMVMTGASGEEWEIARRVRCSAWVWNRKTLRWDAQLDWVE